MDVFPIVRYLLPCQDVQVSSESPKSLNVLGLLTNIVVSEDDSGPYFFEQMCVLVVLAACRGAGTLRLACFSEMTGERVFATSSRSMPKTDDPLQVVPIGFRVRNFSLPHRGFFSLRLEYNEVGIAECTLRVK
jgi:hypothetical protein